MTECRSVVAWGVEEGTAKGTRELFGVMEIFSNLIVMAVVSWVLDN